MSESNFEWTDELVMEFIEYRRNYGSFNDVFKAFKKSHPKAEHKDYEILEWDSSSFKGGGCGVKDEEMASWGFNIKSVKRLSDGEVFSVGDRVNNEWTITEFQIDGNIIYAHFYETSNRTSLKYLLKKVKQPIPLTENNLSEYSLMEMGFNIAREVDLNKPTGRIESYDGDCGECYPYKYKTFFQYVKSKIV